jgi:hypothetical protein
MTATNRCLDPEGSARPRWSREQIRAARMARRAPLLQKRGLQLIELPAGNFEVAAYKGLLLKDSYRRWPQRNLAGNAIDFFVQVLGLCFNDAMRQITAP